jgi:threonine/homoserine/homoserine lactone efflux protein
MTSGKGAENVVRLLDLSLVSDKRNKKQFFGFLGVFAVFLPAHQVACVIIILIVLIVKLVIVVVVVVVIQNPAADRPRWSGRRTTSAPFARRR